ncbi:MAG: hypothetical protein HON90_17310 [Halobacteriovoraceae bacterium]|jgi:hypothetical protein|nr:hypothetical protein [Halobacteriovoraceae bacterium]
MMEGKWLSILEFAAYKKKSISTVRRYIKANRIKFKEENGKYFIWVKSYIPNQTQTEKNQLELKFEFERLKKENNELIEELAEARMLIKLYENGQMLAPLSAKDLPTLPPSL